MNDNSNLSQADQGIDWNEIHQQLDTTATWLAQNSGGSPEESHTTLKKRARLLAREIQQVDTSQEFLEIVEFRLASETYGVESIFVREVFPLKDFTPLPGTPDFVLGIANIRGQILSIIDLKRFFDLPKIGLGQLNKLIILRSEQMEFGILVDDIVGAHSIPLIAIQVAPPTISGIGAEYLRGVTAERVILLDAKKILGDEKIIVDQAAY